MANESLTADHILTTRMRRVRRLAFGPNNTFLCKRRDGRSPFWMIGWYDPTVRTVRYRSTKTTRLADAKAILRKFQMPENAVSLAPNNRRKLSQIYFIGGEAGPIKIGIAYDPSKRLTTLQNMSPEKLAILATAPGTLKDERIYHVRFAEHRLHGEWFERVPAVLAEIDRINSISTGVRP